MCTGKNSGLDSGALGWNVIFTMSLPALSAVSLFNFSYYNGYLVVSHCDFNCIFLMTNDVGHFSQAFWPSVLFL